MRLTTQQVLEIAQLLAGGEIARTAMCRKLAFSLARLSHLLKPIVQSFQEAATPSDAEKEHAERRQEILKKLARKQADGVTPVLRETPAGMMFDIPEDAMAEARAQIDALDSSIPGMAGLRAKRETELAELAQEEVEIDCKPLPLSLFPDNLSVAAARTLLPLLADDDVKN